MSLGSGREGDCTAYAGKTEQTLKGHCTETFKLTGGQITGGVFDMAAKRNYWVVMGGTGRYRGVSGQLDATTTSPDTFDETFRFGG